MTLVRCLRLPQCGGEQASLGRWLLRCIGPQPGKHRGAAVAGLPTLSIPACWRMCCGRGSRLAARLTICLAPCPPIRLPASADANGTAAPDAGPAETFTRLLCDRALADTGAEELLRAVNGSDAAVGQAAAAALLADEAASCLPWALESNISGAQYAFDWVTGRWLAAGSLGHPLPGLRCRCCCCCCTLCQWRWNLYSLPAPPSHLTALR